MSLVRTFIFLVISSFVDAADFAPQLGMLSDKILDETFVGTELPKGWASNTGITGKEPLKATSPDFHVKKPGLVFRVGGQDGQEIAFDNVKVWGLK